MNNINNVRSRKNVVNPDDEEEEEEDVWGFMRKPEQTTSNPKQRQKCSSSFTSSSTKCKPSSSSSTTPKMIPKANNHNNNTTHEANIVLVHPHQSSAPINIPDWSKLYGKNVSKISSKFGSWVDHQYDGKDGNFDDNGDDDDREIIPPHEWLAKKLARSEISSFSVCEGNGRTLKGRDLSEVRNAILTKTGFLEQ